MVLCLGPSYQDILKDTFSASKIDFVAVDAITNAFKSHIIFPTESDDDCESEQLIFAPSPAVPQAESILQWQRLDDVIMGGVSASQWQEINWAGQGSDFLRWTGNLDVISGGFCGTILQDTAVDVRGFDGIKLTVRGDGMRFKLRAQNSASGQIYQLQFDTVKDSFVDVYLPFDAMIAVRQTSVDYRAPSINTVSKDNNAVTIEKLGFIYSKFSFNKGLNRYHRAGHFQLDVKKISLYRRHRPQIVMVSSAGTERINKVSHTNASSFFPS